MDSIVGLGNRITYDFVAPGATKSHTSLDNIVSLENRITYEIVYDFRGDRTTVQLCSCRRRIWASLGKAGITRITYNFRRDRMTDMRPLDDTASTKMYPVVYISVLDWKRDDRHEITHHWYTFPC